MVLVSEDGLRWDFPAGRPEGAESWEETLRREMWEEACARVRSARLLGFTRGRCVRGEQEGEALVRAFWLAEVLLEPWNPAFEIGHRLLVTPAELLTRLDLPEAYLPIYLRALRETAPG